MAENTKEHSAVLTALTFALTFIVIGFPLWWKTTEVYRYPIPHDECKELVSEKVLHVVRSTLVLSDHTVQQGMLWEELLRLHENEDEDFLSTSVMFDWVMRTTTEEEEKAIQLIKDISELDVALDRIDELTHHGEVQILVLNKNFSTDSKFTIGHSRRGYILNDVDFHRLAEDITSLVKTIAQVDLLKKLYTPPTSTRTDNKPDKDRMRHLRSSSAFDVTFTLIVPEPHILDVRWDAEAAIQSYISPFLEELSLISDVKVRSQVLYMTPLPIQFTAQKRVHAENLPSIINPVEARLGSDTSVHANLNFVIYIPTREQTPLQIYDTENAPVSTNAFLSPQWGGFLIHNCLLPDENVSLPYEIELDVREIMEVFLSQFRLLLGLPDLNETGKGTYSIIPSHQIHKWELDFLLRKNSQEQLSVAISSLHSLSQLLQTIKNIVIRDDIGEKIQFALSSTKDSLQLLKNGLLKEGFLKAKAAFIASEEAFFDPSLLALLYFPEGQKYAIYTPLFLPVSIPVIASASYLWKFWKKRKSKKD